MRVLVVTMAGRNVLIVYALDIERNCVFVFGEVCLLNEASTMFLCQGLSLRFICLLCFTSLRFRNGSRIWTRRMWSTNCSRKLGSHPDASPRGVSEGCSSVRSSHARRVVIFNSRRMFGAPASSFFMPELYVCWTHPGDYSL